MHVSYSWIGRPMQTHTKSIRQQTKRATIYLRPWTKSSRQITSIGVVNVFIDRRHLVKSFSADASGTL